MYVSRSWQSPKFPGYLGIRTSIMLNISPSEDLSFCLSIVPCLLWIWDKSRGDQFSLKDCNLLIDAFHPVIFEQDVDVIFHSFSTSLEVGKKWTRFWYFGSKLVVYQSHPTLFWDHLMIGTKYYYYCQLNVGEERSIFPLIRVSMLLTNISIILLSPELLGGFEMMLLLYSKCMNTSICTHVISVTGNGNQWGGERGKNWK